MRSPPLEKMSLEEVIARYDEVGHTAARVGSTERVQEISSNPDTAKGDNEGSAALLLALNGEYNYSEKDIDKGGD